MKKLLFLFILIILATSTIAQSEYHLKLLAVQENADGYTGSEADLYLELKEGSGRVFLDTFPLTKLDTQISTRYAKDVACSFFKLNCNQYDFIYTIKSNSNIIGGPSAGAAIAALTTIAVLDLDYDDKVAITGTINSGGIIGPVGGVKEKLEAASKNSIRKVLIAKGNREFKEGNITTDLINYSKINLSLTTIEVLDLDEVLFELTGKKLRVPVKDLVINPQYDLLMQEVKEILCNRTDKIEQRIEEENLNLPINFTKDIQTQKERSNNASNNKDYYSAASFCFNNNIQLKREVYKSEKVTDKIINESFTTLKEKNALLKERLRKKPIKTISDLQTYSIVKERLNDVDTQIEKINQSNNEEKRNILAYTEERYFSALSWMQFYNMEGKSFTFNDKILKQSCLQKLSEAEERHQYASLFLPQHVAQIKEKINDARAAYEKNEPALCLITASQAKGEANSILSSLGVDEESMTDYLAAKRKATERVIAENSAEGIFPILGYSYYQYANSLESQNKYTALVYLEYALEMSNLQIYFPQEYEFVTPKFDSDTVIFIEGVLVGILISLVAIIAIRLRRKYKRSLK